MYRQNFGYASGISSISWQLRGLRGTCEIYVALTEKYGEICKKKKKKCHVDSVTATEAP